MAPRDKQCGLTTGSFWPINDEKNPGRGCEATPGLLATRQTRIACSEKVAARDFQKTKFAQRSLSYPQEAETFCRAHGTIVTGLSNYLRLKSP